MKLLFTCLLLMPFVGWAQEQPLAKAVSTAKASGKADFYANLFTANGTAKAVSNALNASQPIQHLTLNTSVLKNITSQKHQLLHITLPTAEGTLELEVVPAILFAPGFKVLTAVPDPNFTLDVTKFQYYNGVIKDIPSSIVVMAISENSVVATIADQNGNRVLAKGRDATVSATDYALYNENAVMTQKPALTCGTPDSAIRSTSMPSSQGKGTFTHSTNSTNCQRYVGVYVEADYAMYQHYNSNTNNLAAFIAFQFEQVVTLYRSDGINVQLAQVYIWNIPDPYNNPEDSEQALNRFEARWRAMNNNFPGQLAHLLTTRDIGGGLGELSSLGNRSLSYSVSGNLHQYNSTAQPYPTYSWEVFIVTHELGHNLGSNHTQWCGWEGGPLDNCYPTENNNGPCVVNKEVVDCPQCGRGPTPTNGGTIMSYCHITKYVNSYINFTHRFGPQPRQAILDKMASVYEILPFTTSDSIVESIANGDWASASTWACGYTPNSMRNVIVGGGHAVQLNTNESVKSVNINGNLNLSNTSSNININN